MATPSGQHRGWHWNLPSSRLEIIIDGTKVGHFDDTGSDLTLDTNGLTVTAGGITVTAGGSTITGDLTVDTDDIRISAGNVRLGTISTFGTTEPTAWVVFRSATQPAGAITTAGGVGANDTTVQKIIAAGTINNVET